MLAIVAAVKMCVDVGLTVWDGVDTDRLRSPDEARRLRQDVVPREEGKIGDLRCGVGTHAVAGCWRCQWFLTRYCSPSRGRCSRCRVLDSEARV